MKENQKLRKLRHSQNEDDDGKEEEETPVVSKYSFDKSKVEKKPQERVTEYGKELSVGTAEYTIASPAPFLSL